MELRDLIVTPVILILVFWGAYIVRPWVTDEVTRKYFFPALWVRVFGALCVGFLYQFYYGGGDTFMYHTYGSRIMWEIFVEDPIKWIELIFSSGDVTGLYEYTSRIWFITDPTSFFVIKVGAFLDLLTFSTYSSTAVLFSLLSFSGAWAFYTTFYKSYPHLHKYLAIAILFIPSVIFWGSGIVKDTLTLAAVGFLTYATHKIFLKKEKTLGISILLLISILVLYKVKVYILICYLPALIIWVNFGKLAQIRSKVFKLLIIPFATLLIISLGYFALSIVGKSDPRYAVNNLGRTAQITAYDIAYQSGRDAGSTYVLGELDGSFESLLRLAPQSIVVSLFRPYVWEIRNPLMFLSALESFIIFWLTLYVLYKKKVRVLESFRSPNILFCMIFSLSFAFAVGVSTFNFGTLARYKIPMLPFYLIGLILMLNYSKEEDSVI